MYGADVLRLFVGSFDFGGDMACPSGVSDGRDTAVHAASSAYAKLRNAFKYLIGNLQDFDLKAVILLLQ